MAKFTYSARDHQGQRVTGSDEAASADILISRLQLKGLFITGITAEPEKAADKEIKSKPLVHKFSHTGVKEEDLTLFARQLSTILGSGVPLLKSLNAILRQVDSRKFYSMLEEVTANVEAGFSLRDALAKYPRVFPALWLNLIETGEASGSLPAVLEKLAGYLEVKAAFKRKIVSAMVYPMILMFVALTAIVVFILVIVPKFTEIFKGFDIQLPLATKILIFISEFLQKKFFLIFISIGSIIFLFRRFVQTKQGKALFDEFILKVPVLNDFITIAETERFCSTMATLLESGVPIIYCLEIAESSVGNSVVQRVIAEVKANVTEGKSLVEPLEKSGFFPPMVVQMISIGEEIGELDKMLNKIANFYSELLENRVTRLTVMFEPLMIIVMGAIIGGMVVSMFLPIFEIANIGTK